MYSNIYAGHHDRFTDEINLTAPSNLILREPDATSEGALQLTWGGQTFVLQLNTDDALAIIDPGGSFEYEIKNTEFVAFNDQTLSFNELMEPFFRILQQ